jgi:hypothetical protein
MIMMMMMMISNSNNDNDSSITNQMTNSSIPFVGIFLTTLSAINVIVKTSAIELKKRKGTK